MLGQGRCGQMSYANIYYESLDQFIKIMHSLVFKGPELNVRSLLHCIYNYNEQFELLFLDIKLDFLRAETHPDPRK